MRESQRKRGAKVELVDEVVDLYNQARAGESQYGITEVCGR